MKSTFVALKYFSYLFFLFCLESCNPFGSSSITSLFPENITLPSIAPVTITAPSFLALTQVVNSNVSVQDLTLEVHGVVSGQTVTIFTDSSCLNQVASAPVTVDPALVTVQIQNHGKYIFYAQVSDGISTSPCSSVYASHNFESWVQQAYIKARNVNSYDHFGTSVSLFADTLVVGAPHEDSDETVITNGLLASSNNLKLESGAVYVYKRNGHQWVQEAYIKPSNSGTNDEFGSQVSVYENQLAVSAINEDSNQTTITNGSTANSDNSRTDSGAVYVFTRLGILWSQSAFIKAVNSDANDKFGSSISLHKNILAVSAVDEDSSVTTITNGVSASTNNLAVDSGAVYIYQNTSEGWVQQAYIKAANAESTDHFGSSLQLNGDTLVIGSTGEDSSVTTITNGVSASIDNSAADSGAVYVYKYNGQSWSQQAYIKPSNAGAGDKFGHSVALYGDLLAISSSGEDSNQTTIVSGTLASSDNSYSDSGAVYIYQRNNDSWQQEAYIKAGNVGVSDLFGTSVSLFENSLAVSAINEDSNQTTITNGDMSSANEALSDSGAVYIYKRSDTGWAQEAYIKAINADANDRFGHKIQIFGKSLAVASINESSSQNSNSNSMTEASTDNSRFESGAVYIYNFEGTIKALITSGLPQDITNQNTLNASVGGVDISSYRYKLGEAPLDCSDSAGYSVSQSVSSSIIANMTSLNNGPIVLCLIGYNSYGVQEYTDATIYKWTKYAVDPTAPTTLSLVNPVSSPGYTNTPTLNLSGYSSETVRLILYGDAGCTETIAQATVSSTTVTMTTPELSQKNYRFKARSVDNIGNISTCSTAFVDYYFQGWMQQAYIKAANASASDLFGSSVSLHNDTLAVGASAEDSNQTTITNGSVIVDNNVFTDSGAVYVYKRTQSSWVQEAYIKAANAGASDSFGSSVSLNNDTLAVGATAEDSNQTTITNGNTIIENNLTSNSGAVYVYKRTGNSWAQQAYIKAVNPSVSDTFGTVVSLNSDTLVVGVNLEDSNQTTITNGSVIVDNDALTDSGAVYVYKRTGSVWVQEAYIKAANAGNSDYFGSSVSLDSDTLAVGSNFEDSNQTTITNGSVIVDNNFFTDSGAVYIYKRGGVSWTQQAYIKAANNGSGDNFGVAVSLNSDTLAVGANYEDSNRTTITNGSVIVENNSLADSGAVYVYKRTGNNWAQEAYIKAANAGSADYFGNSVSLNADTLAVGARLEDSNQITITNGNTIIDNNSASNNGAVYIYKRSGVSWTQQAYIKAANSGTSDFFGAAVSLSLDTLAVAAASEDSNQTTITNGLTANANDTLTDSGAVYIYINASSIQANIANGAPNLSSGITKLNMLVGGNGINSYRYKIGVAPLDCSDPSGYSSIISTATPITDNIYSLADGPMVLCIVGINGYGQQSFTNATKYEWNKYNVPPPADPSGITLLTPASSPGHLSKPTFSVQGVSVSHTVRLYTANDCNLNSLVSMRIASATTVSMTLTAPLKVASNTIYATQMNDYDIESNCSNVSIDYFLETWQQQSYIKAINSDIEDMFGQSVSLSKNTLAVGAIGEDSNQTTITNGQSASLDNLIYNSGAVYIYTRSGASWSQQAYIKPIDTDYNDFFGYSVSLDKDTLAVGAIYENSNQTTITNGTNASTDNSLTDSGAVYIYKRTGNNWAQESYIKATNADISDQFGTTISLANDTLAVGAIYEDSNQTTITNSTTASANNSSLNSGAVYVYKRAGQSWYQEAYIKAVNAGSGDLFGAAVSLSKDTLAVGALYEDSNQTTITNGATASSNESAVDSGSVYVYARSGSSWTQQAYIKAANSETGDQFGAAISLSENTLAVGAIYEDSNLTTITNSASATLNNSTLDSGAVYVYTRAGSSWTQQAYIKASNSEASDYFGSSVSVSNDFLVVGSINEDSSANQVIDPEDSLLLNNGVANGGAVYVYQRSGSQWASRAVLKADNNHVDLQFGQNVVIDGTTLAVATINDYSNQQGISNGKTASQNNANKNSGAVYVYQLEGRPQAVIANGDPGIVNFDSTTLNLQIGGSGLIAYRFKIGSAPLDCTDPTGYSSSISVSIPISTNLAALADGQVTLCIVGVNNYGQQNFSNATTYTWVKNTVVPSMPTAVTLVSPTATVSNINTVTLGVSGLTAGEIVMIYTDAACTQQITQKHILTTSENVQFRLNNLGDYKFYARAVNAGGNKSACSTSFVSYNYNLRWSQQAYIKASNATANDYFGSSVSINNDTIAVSAINEDSNQTTITNGPTASSDNSLADSGAVYVYKRAVKTWVQEAYIKAANAGSSDIFGSAISLNNDTLVISATSEDSNQTTITNGLTASSDNSLSQAGAVYVYKRTGSTWAQEAYIKAANAGSADSFGSAVSLNNDTLVISATGEDSNQTTITNGISASSDNSLFDSGAVYIYKRIAGNWMQEAYIKAANAGSSDSFGFAISLNVDTLAVGAYFEDSNLTTITNGTSIVNNELLTDSGAVYVYKRNGSLWAQEAYIKAANAGNADYFGRSVSLDGQSLAVGAYNEDSAQTTITNGIGASADNTATNSGAVYIYKRTGSNWAQEAYIKAANSASGDSFGNSVALNQDYLAVTANFEDSNQTTITNGDQIVENNLLTDSGAVYVYSRAGASWTQHAYIKAVNASVSDYFGSAISLDNDTLVVSANREDSNQTTITNGSVVIENNSVADSGAVYVYQLEGKTKAVIADGNPNIISSQTTALNLKIGGNGITSYRFKIGAAPLDCSDSNGYSALISTNNPITTNLTSYLDGTIVLCIVGVNSNGQQSYSTATTYTWVKDTITPSVPHSLTLVSPSVAQSNVDQLVIGVSGLTAGQVVMLYSDAACTRYVTQKIVTSATENITFKLNELGGYSFYAKNMTAAGSASSCSTDYVNYYFDHRWKQEAYIKAVNTMSSDYFGNAVSLSENTLAVGAYQEDSNQTTITNGNIVVDNNLSSNSGAVYVYSRSGVSWSQQAYIKAANAGTGDFFGFAVSLSENTLAVGAYQEDSNQTTITNGNSVIDNNSLTDSGAVYVYSRSGVSWSQQAYIKAANAGGTDYFGFDIAIHNDTLAVSAQREDSNQTTITNGNVIVDNNGLSDSGAVYVYARTGASWTQQAYIKAANAGISDYFGTDVSINNDTLVISANREDSNQTTITNGNVIVENNGLADSGAVYVYKRDGASWTQQAYIKAANAGGTDYFGNSISLNNDTLAVGAYREDSNQITITNSNVIVDNNGLTDSGAVYVYKRDGASWTQQAYIKAANAGNSDNFGSAVSLQGDTLVVAAILEDSNQLTITNGETIVENNGSLESGAVYIYKRTGNNWAQDAYIKAGNAHTSAFFGSSISISGQLLAVGAYGENSNHSTIINGENTGLNNFYNDSGAVYVYRLDYGARAELTNIPTSTNASVTNLNLVNANTALVSYKYKIGPSPLDCTNSAGYSVAIPAATPITDNISGLPDGNITICIIGNDGNFEQNYSLATTYTWFKDTIAPAKPNLLMSTPNALPTTIKAPIFLVSNTNNSVNTRIYSDSLCSVLVATTSTTGNDTYVTLPNLNLAQSYTFYAKTIDNVGNESLCSDDVINYRIDLEWQQTAYVKAANSDVGDLFGTSIAIDADTLVVGAPGESSNSTTITDGDTASANDSLINSGAVYVYKRDGVSWTQQAYIKAVNSDENDSFGVMVALHGDTLAVGANKEDSNQTTITNGLVASSNNSTRDSGAVYVYKRTGNVWSQQAYIKSNLGTTDMNYGAALSLHEDTLVVGDSSLDELAANTGSVYVYKRTGAIWAQEAYLKAVNAQADDGFGVRLANYENTLAVSALGEDSNQTIITNGLTASADNSAAQSGAVYIYTRSGVTWTQQAYIKAANSGANDIFGSSVSLCRDTLVVGAESEDSNQTTITNGLTASGNNLLTDSGAVYVYTRSGVSWTQQAYIKAVNADTLDLFGSSISCSGDMLAVGTSAEDSNQTTITNGLIASSNNMISESGAVYVYKRNGTSWSQLAYIKAANADAGDFFGINVSLDQNTLAVAATREASNQTLLTNGNIASADNSLYNAGAVYVYNLVGDSKAVINSNQPTGSNNINWLNIIVGGFDISEYRYKFGFDNAVDCTNVSGYSSWRSIAVKIDDDISEMSAGNIKLCLLGKTSTNVIQSLTNPSEYKWKKAN